MSEYGIGATTVGLRQKNFVILASEKRISYGGFVLSKSGKKVYKITDYMGIAGAGLFADIQILSRIIAAELEYQRLTMGRKPTIKAAAKLLAVILYSHKYLPYLSELLVGGIEEDGTTRLYVMDPLGSLIEDDYAAIGSGAPIAIGVLERGYHSNLSLEEAKKLVIDAMRAALERDPISGDGVDILIIKREDGRVSSSEETLRF
ncbi:MAG: archaeal proteasome endopeptidase complex subunit beta [Pyrodictiaceae archaeon]